MEKLIYDDIIEKLSRIKRFVFTDEIILEDIPLQYNFVSWYHDKNIYIQMDVIFTESDEELQKIFMRCISRIKRCGKQCTYIMNRNNYLCVRFFYFY
jgi:hypothetical protein